MFFQIWKDYEEAKLNLEKAEKKLFFARENVQIAAKNVEEAEKKMSGFGDSKDGRKKIKNRRKNLTPKKGVDREKNLTPKKDGRDLDRLNEVCKFTYYYKQFGN